MKIIKSLTAREIFDSRGTPTLEVTCELVSGFSDKACIPSGASTGIHEAVELRDKDMSRFNGNGVLQAISHVENVIAPLIVGKEFNQIDLDQYLIEFDGTKDKSRLGANALLGISLSFARACAKEDGEEFYSFLGKNFDTQIYTLPQPMLNIINGGKHADSGLNIQEFMIAPVGFDSLKRKLQAGAEIISALKHILKERDLSVGVGDEGGFAPKLNSNEEAFDLLVEAINKAGYSTTSVKIAIDVAASSFFSNGFYTLKIKGVKKSISSSEFMSWYKELVEKYPIISIEDPFAEDDWDGFTQMRSYFNDSVQIVGDDLTVTNVERIQYAYEKNAITSVLIKPNQIGTLTETIDAILLTKKYGWKPFMSHRSGETTDTTIADIAVGLGCDFIKSGSLVRGERVCKYNRLMEIENKLQK